jgi:hypothetical protein
VGSGSSSWLDGVGTAAGVFSPRYLAVDTSADTFYLTDGNNYVREVSLESSID